MRKINLLYIITKLELGGAQKQLLSLITSLDPRRYSIFLITAEKGLLDEDAHLIPGLKVIHSRCLERPINPLKDLLALVQIYRFIKENNIEAVHTHSSKAGILGRLAARLAGVKAIVHTVHGWSFNDYQSKACRSFAILLERMSAHFTNKLIVVCEHDLEKGLAHNVGSRSKFALIPYAINYSEFASSRDPVTRRELGLNPEDLIIGMMSCFKPQKSPLDFIKLAYLVHKSFSRAKFILIGDGELRRVVEKQIKEYDLVEQVVLTGWRRDIPRLLSAMDIFVLTSIWEGLPISVLEAMAASLPVVATNTGGVSEIIVDSKTGFLVKRKDMDNMSEKVIMLLEDAGLRREIGFNARKYCLEGNFTIDNALSKTHRVYETLMPRMG